MARSAEQKSIAFYFGASLGYAALVTCLALWSTGNWSNFYNARPTRGEMGLGRFLIRGSRIVNGQHTPFAYAWRLVKPTTLTWLSTWIGYLLHQLGQWYILAKVQQCNTEKTYTWSNEHRWWNWQMVYLNVFMMAYKLVQGHLFYDGLAIDVSEGTAQGSVIAVLIVALLLAVPRRGIFLNLGRLRSSDLFKEFMAFVRKYHGYVMSFGTIYNFHYHPVEGTMGHFGGFLYQCLLLWQSASFLHTSHRNKSWNLLLETWVFVHGTLTAICQPGTAWQIFSYGFMIIFLTNQIYDTPIPKRYPHLMAAAYALFAIATALGFQQDRAYYRMTFVPVAEYLCLILCIVVGISTTAIVKRVSSTVVRRSIIIFTYIAMTAALTVGLAVVLAGNLKVYNDY